MNQFFEVIAVSSKGKELDEVENTEGVRTIELEMSREITPLKDLLSLLKMIRLLYKEKPQIVHTHTPKAGIVGMLAAWITRVPHRLHTVAGLPVMEAEGKKKKILLWVEKITYACATHVYPNSLGLKRYILEQKLTPENKLKVIGYGSSNGIDTTYFDRTPEVMRKSKEIKEHHRLENNIVFCFVGRVVKDKGIDELLYAFDKLSNEVDHVRLMIVGKMEENLDPISSESYAILSNNKHIIQAGFQKDIRPYLASSDIFVLPTYREGFPNVVLQAASMGLPCIVTDINGCNEIVTDRENGLLIPPKNEDALYGAMKSIVQDKKMIAKFGSNSRDDIIRKYERRQFFQFLLDEYNEVLAHV